MTAKKKKKAGKNPLLCKVGTEVQSVIFDGSKWTRSEARSWLLEHKLKAPAADVQKNKIRYRQKSPNKFDKESFRTKKIPRNGIQLIIGCPKKQSSRTSTKKNVRKVNARMNVPKVLVELGKAVEIALDHSLLEFKKHDLFSNVSGTKLYIIHAKAIPSQVTETKEIKKARSLYSKFTDFEAENNYRIKIDSEDFDLLGKADHIVYESYKWTGKKTEYIHEFVDPPSIHANKAKTIFILTGKIHVRREGITG